ncbi:hypothetical protein GCM10027030_30290 [Luteococcus sediminum]
MGNRSGSAVRRVDVSDPRACCGSEFISIRDAAALLAAYTLICEEPVCRHQMYDERARIVAMTEASTLATLPLPTYVAVTLGNRTRTVLEHGFPRKQVGPEWWTRELHRQGLGQSVGTFEHGAEQRLTRANLFRLGTSAAMPNASDDAVLEFLWHVLAWGTGPSQRGNRRRIAAFATPEASAKNLPLLRSALNFAATGDSHSAYSSLIRRGGGVIPCLGPAFFTKVLYFASETTTGTRCLILDARVAANLYSAGWKTLPHRGGNFSYNWFTTTYVDYCELLARWAEEVSQELGTTVWPDEIERTLFEGPDA